MPDGCSYWFDGNWKHCCDLHDLAYIYSTGKLEADWELFQCVAGTGNPIMGFIMFIGVSLGGWIWYRNKRK